MYTYIHSPVGPGLEAITKKTAAARQCLFKDVEVKEARQCLFKDICAHALVKSLA